MNCFLNKRKKYLFKNELKNFLDLHNQKIICPIKTSDFDIYYDMLKKKDPPDYEFLKCVIEDQNFKIIGKCSRFILKNIYLENKLELRSSNQNLIDKQIKKFKKNKILSTPHILFRKNLPNERISSGTVNPRLRVVFPRSSAVSRTSTTVSEFFGFLLLSSFNSA